MVIDVIITIIIMTVSMVVIVLIGVFSLITLALVLFQTAQLLSAHQTPPLSAAHLTGQCAVGVERKKCGFSSDDDKHYVQAIK